MLKDFFRSKYFLIILLSAVAIILMLLSLRSGSKAPTLITTKPASGFTKLSVVAPLTLIFDGTVSPDDFRVSSSPTADFSISSSDERSLTLTPVKPLTQKTPYTLTIFFKDRVLKTLSYKTEETQTDYEVIDKIKGEIARDFPLASQIPYETVNFKVIYSSPLTLQISLKNNTLSESQVIESVKSWVVQAGGDASIHKYVVVPPSQ